MVLDRALYDVLGVDPRADQAAIIKAARAKALEHHPDRGGSVEMMQKINAAREILTDPEKRRIYDQYGLEGMKSGLSNENFGDSSIFDLLRAFTGGAGPRGDRRKPQANDIKHVLRVSLEDLYMGNTKTVNIDRDVVCNDCNGTGCNDGISRQCTECDGTGIETLVYRMGPMIQQVQGKCQKCGGQGNMINNHNRCKNCRGNKLSNQKKKLVVNIVPGSQDGETVRFIGEGNQIPKGESGSIHVILKQEPHPLFERVKDDIIMKMDINLTESLCGFQRLIKLLDNHEILMNHPPGMPIVPNSYRSMKGYGMPNRHTHSHGDLIIHFQVQFPPNNFILNEDQKKKLESVLPPKSAVKLSSTASYEQVPMVECDFHQRNFRNHEQHQHQHDDDDDEYPFHGAPQGVRCHQQ